MAKELDNKKMWECLIKRSKHIGINWFSHAIEDALKEQGFKFDDENIVPIEKEFKIEAGKFYVCIKPCLGYTVGKIYEAVTDGFIIADTGVISYNCSTCLDRFRPVTEKELFKIDIDQLTEESANDPCEKLRHSEPTKKSGQEELTEFENRLGEILFPTWDVMRGCVGCEAENENVKKLSAELLSIARKQIAEELKEYKERAPLSLLPTGWIVGVCDCISKLLEKKGE